MGGSWKDTPSLRWWQTIGRCGRCRYRGWTISYDPPPIPMRDFDWTATGPNFDASYEGAEDGYASNGEQVHAATREALIAEIDGWLAEQVSA